MQAYITNYKGDILHTINGNSKKRIFNKIKDAKIIVPYDGYIRLEDNLLREYFKMTSSGKIVSESNYISGT